MLANEKTNNLYNNRILKIDSTENVASQTSITNVKKDFVTMTQNSRDNKSKLINLTT